MSWKEFETRPPRMASPGFERLNRKVSYLATLKKDGSPNLHPTPPFIGNGMLFMSTEPSSPKINDLCSDGRYALHCSLNRQKDEPLKEFLVNQPVEGKIAILRSLAGALDAALVPVLAPFLRYEHPGLHEALRDAMPMSDHGLSRKKSEKEFV